MNIPLLKINFRQLMTFIFLAMLSPAAFAQGNNPVDPELKIYRAAPSKINDLIHTELDVRFDYGKRHLLGKEWVTLKPHFYATDTLRLDAKGMDLHQIAILKNGKYKPLKYKYDDSTSIAIRLDKVYHRYENYTIYISYTAKPDELNLKGRSAVLTPKGLFFINPDGKEKNKPVQIYTQGETENSSAWFPTIDKPNQKTTQEISITVPSKYATVIQRQVVFTENEC